jgi:hypothetical protein
VRLILLLVNSRVMRTRKKGKKVTSKQVQHQSNPTFDKPFNRGEFDAEEGLAEKHFSIDEDWKPVRKSKGADEEG